MNSSPVDYKDRNDGEEESEEKSELKKLGSNEQMINISACEF